MSGELREGEQRKRLRRTVRGWCWPATVRLWRPWLTCACGARRFLVYAAQRPRGWYGVRDAAGILRYVVPRRAWPAPRGWNTGHCALLIDSASTIAPRCLAGHLGHRPIKSSFALILCRSRQLQSLSLYWILAGRFGKGVRYGRPARRYAPTSWPQSPFPTPGSGSVPGDFFEGRNRQIFRSTR